MKWNFCRINDRKVYLPHVAKTVVTQKQQSVEKSLCSTIIMSSIINILLRRGFILDFEFMNLSSLIVLNESYYN